MRPLTLDTPKPLLKINNKPILEHILESLPQEIDEVFIVVGYLADKIQSHFGARWNGFKIGYAFQKNKSGTAHALKLCESKIKDGEKFLLLFADDLHGKEGLKNCVKKDLGLLVGRAENPERFGVVNLNSDRSVREIVEKPEKPQSDIVSTGVMVLDKRIFHYEADKHPNGEFYLTDSVNKMIKEHKIFAVESDFWLPIGYPEDLKKAGEILKNSRSENN